ncbi:MAG: cell division protein FtsZ [Candidatus Shapirobacteria bacterium]|nr:cell division protein FtsZ [Candidatus Shapirobacteria bacterium]MDD5481667.1 cell division protein FtsZ [Candidatus Shapirobacteria bacterium]
MAFVKPESNRFAQIKVLGVGGGGGNCINSMVADEQIKGIDFVAINTDAQALLTSQSPIKIQIGEKLTRGLGAGGNPEIGQKAAEESIEKIKKLIAGSDMVFITGGEGGGTCTGAAPVIARAAKEMGILTVAVVTKPFHFEGHKRMAAANEGISQLEDQVDTLIVVPNQKLLSSVNPKTSLVEAFKMVDSVLISGVEGIAGLITKPGLINLDFADVKAIIANAGSALMGIGEAEGDKRAVKAAQMAADSPLLETSIEGARGILFNISGGQDLGIKEVEEAAEIIFSQADPDANIIFGATIDKQLGEKIKITLIATGFDQSKTRLSRLAKNTQPNQVINQNLQGFTPQNKNPKGQVIFDNSQKKTLTKNYFPDSDNQVADQGEGKAFPVLEDLGEEYETPAFLRQGKKKLVN